MPSTAEAPARAGSRPESPPCAHVDADGGVGRAYLLDVAFESAGYLVGLLVIQTFIGIVAYALTRRMSTMRPVGLTAAGLLVVAVGGVSTALAAGALI